MIDPQIWSPSTCPFPSDRIRLFAPAATSALGQAMSVHLGHPLARMEERDFEDGEHKARPLDTVAGADVYVVHSLHGGSDGSANDRLCRLLFFVATLKDAGAARVTALVPYLCYARKDRRTKANDPVSTRYVASLFEAMGLDRVAVLDVHNPAAYENAFRIRAVSLTAAPLLVAAVAEQVGAEALCVISPDLGGGKRADAFREMLEATIGRPVRKAFAEKHRSEGVVSGDLFAGDVKDATCVIVDDLISTGGTILRAAQAARRNGAKRVLACITHGLFSSEASAVLAHAAIDAVLMTDSVHPIRLPEGPARAKLRVVTVAPLLAEAVRRLRDDAPLDDLGAS